MFWLFLRGVGLSLSRCWSEITVTCVDLKIGVSASNDTVNSFVDVRH